MGLTACGGSNAQSKLFDAARGPVAGALGDGTCDFVDGRIAGEDQFAACEWRTGKGRFELAQQAGIWLALTGTIGGCYRVGTSIWIQGTTANVPVVVEIRRVAHGLRVISRTSTANAPAAPKLPVSPAESCTRLTLLAPELTLNACIRVWNGDRGLRARPQLVALAKGRTVQVVNGQIKRLGKGVYPDCSVHFGTSVWYSPHTQVPWSGPIPATVFDARQTSSAHVFATVGADGRLTASQKLPALPTRS